ncbi:hypothetical protein Hanom_Chr02g00097701 [Helianthus anomalus]
MDYHVLNFTKRKKSFFINFLPNTQNRFIAISKHNNQIIRLKTQSQTPSQVSSHKKEIYIYIYIYIYILYIYISYIEREIDRHAHTHTFFFLIIKTNIFF